MTDTIEKMDGFDEKKDAEELPAGYNAELPEGVHRVVMQDKDAERLRALQDLEAKLGQAALAILRGISKTLGELAQLEASKQAVVVSMQDKYDFPKDALWSANFQTKELFWKAAEKASVQEVQKKVDGE